MTEQQNFNYAPPMPNGQPTEQQPTAPTPQMAPAPTAPAPQTGAPVPFGNPNQQEVFEISEEEFAEVEEGTYNGVLVAVEKKESQAGNPMYAWTFAIVDGVHAGKEMMSFTALTPNAIWKLKEVLVALGVQPQNGKFSFTSQQVVNKRVRLEIEITEYNDQKRPSIKKVLKP